MRLEAVPSHRMSECLAIESAITLKCWAFLQRFVRSILYGGTLCFRSTALFFLPGTAASMDTPIPTAIPAILRKFLKSSVMAWNAIEIERMWAACRATTTPVINTNILISEDDQIPILNFHL